MLYFYISGTIFFTVFGQIILKWRIGRYGELPLGVTNKVVFLCNVLLDPFVLSGLLSAFIASFFWMAAMTKSDVSFAYPFITAGLTLLTVFAAALFLGEALTPPKFIGIIFIILGVIIMHLPSKIT